VNGHFHPLGDSIDSGNTHAVKATANLVGTVVKFPTCVKFRHDDFRSRNAEFFVKVYWYPSTIVSDGKRAARVQGDFDNIVVPRQVLVNRVVNNFPNAVVKGGSVVRISKIHARSFSYCFKAFKDLNTCCVI
jgi:hypothetical protein